MVDFLPALLSRFPVYIHPPIPAPPAYPVLLPTLCIAPPRPAAPQLSADVESLKWQAYLALRGIDNIALRWDISPEGAPDARLPFLLLPDSSPRFLSPRSIPGWADTRLQHQHDPLEGYRDQHAKDECHAWIALLEGVVHAALSLSSPTTPLLAGLLQSNFRRSRDLATVLSPPPPPSTGVGSLLPPFGANIDPSAIYARYAEATAALSDRLASDKWFLGSENPTALDALVFAYLHTLIHFSEATRIQVARRPNLVAWERSVRTLVQGAFSPVLPTSP